MITMKPTSPGIYEWFDRNGTKHLVEVVDVCKGFVPLYLGVYFAGGYYNVNELEILFSSTVL